MVGSNNTTEVFQGRSRLNCRIYVKYLHGLACLSVLLRKISRQGHTGNRIIPRASVSKKTRLICRRLLRFVNKLGKGGESQSSSCLGITLRHLRARCFSVKWERRVFTYCLANRAVELTEANRYVEQSVGTFHT